MISNSTSTTSAARVLVAIPARWASTRFPGKPLALLDSQPVIAHVVRAALQAEGIERPVLVATDDERIAQAVRDRFEAQEVQAVMTDAGLPSGTDRLAQALRAHLGEPESAPEAWEERLAIINVQGDEPFLNPSHIERLARAMREHPELKMATLGVPLSQDEDILNPNIIKIARAQDGRALYFSRAPIPFHRDEPVQRKYLRHLGVYAYEARWLLEMAALGPSPLEEIERLEQLRALEHGVAIRVLEVESAVDIAIDTPQDLERAQLWLRRTPDA